MANGQTQLEARDSRFTIPPRKSASQTCRQNIDPAVPAADAPSAIFFNSGQVCCAGARLYVPKKIFDQVVGDLSVLAGKMKVCCGLAPATELGPLVLSAQIELGIS